ncbi:MAG: DUF6273 domain-containing protein [Lachnospiraceae bacterium]|nr:DUF6273 domain-containing protein [Lachnospiraceae bacterium]
MIKKAIWRDKSLKSRVFSAFLGITMLTETFITALLPLTDIPVYADNGKTISGLSIGTIADPAEGAGGWSYVYYGKYGTDAMKYRVLTTATTDFGGKTMLLDCNSSIVNREFDGNTNKNWADSGIKEWLNGNEFYKKTGVFTAQENAAIACSTKPNKVDGDGNGLTGTRTLGYAPLKDDHIFLLDAVEATRPSYGFAAASGSTDTRTKIGKWWLRSPFTTNNEAHAGEVLSNGELLEDYVGNEHGVSPSFNLNLESVIFSSVISAENKEYKLTLKDEDMTIAQTADSKISRLGNVVTVPYTITGGEPTQVSVLITEKEYSAGTVLTTGYQYLKLSVDKWGTSGTGTFTLPDAYADKTCGTDYYAYIFAEDVNEGTATDYASVPVPITISEPEYAVTVTVDPAGSGNAIASVKSEKSGTEVKLTATPNDGYEFREWNVMSGGVTLADPKKASTTFKIGSANVEVKATFTKKETPSVTYTVKTSTDGNGTATASPASGKTGTEVKLIATPNEGYEFKEWTVVSGGVTLADPKKASTTFKIGSANVEVKAFFAQKTTPIPGPSPEPTPDVKTSIKNATVKLSKTSLKYNGKAQKPTVKSVKLNGKTLDGKTDYTVSWSNSKSKKPGTYKVTITGKGNYKDSKTVNYKIVQGKNPLTVKIKKKTLSVPLSKLKKENQTIKRSKYLNVSKGQGKVTYKRTTGDKKIVIDKTTGKITVKKGLKAGTYSVTISVKAAGNKNYKAATKKVTVKIVVK